MAVLNSRASVCESGSSEPMNSENDGTEFVSSLKYVGLRFGIGSMGVASVARPRVEEEEVEIIATEAFRRGAECKHRNLVAMEAMVMNEEVENIMAVGDVESRSPSEFHSII